MKNYGLVSTFVMTALLHGSIAFGQDAGTERAQQNAAIYRSSADELLTLQRVSILPFTDNVEGIYSRPTESHVVQRLQNSHRWNLIEPNSVGPVLSPDELEGQADKVKSLANQIGTDALLVGRVTKGPNGINIKMNLFLARDGKLIAQGMARDLPQFQISEVKSKIDEVLGQVFSRIPYEGLILSRQNQRVTVSLGKKDGMEPNKIVNAVQIIDLKRHPKFDFLINTEKEILGKIRLIKVEDTLSFGQIISEKGAGTIQKGTKISGIEFVTYAGDNAWQDPQSQDSLLQKPESVVTFGKDAQEWLPKKPPTFGQVGARFGLASFDGSLTTSENLSATNNVYPSIGLNGELWLTPNWTIHTSIRQGIIEIKNPKSGTGKSNLSQSLTSYDFLMSYTTRFGAGAWAPKVDILGGYGVYRLFVDDAVDGGGNRGFTTLQYSGIKLGVSGSYPITQDQSWSLGGRYFFFLNPSLKESPISSGSSHNTINEFGFFGAKRLSPNMKVQANLDFELYATEYSGGRASSGSQRHTTLSGGVYYMF